MEASGRPTALLSMAITCSLRDLAVEAGRKEGALGRGLHKLFPLYFVQADSSQTESPAAMGEWSRRQAKGVAGGL